MARFGLTFEAAGYRDTLGRFTRRTEELEKVRRDLVREGGAITVKQLKIHAPRKTGKFAAGLFYRTYDFGDTAEARFYAGGEHGYLLPFLAFGTADHIIPTGGSAAQKHKGYPLRFFWEKGPRGAGIYSYWQVHHPGTNAHPFIGYARVSSQPLLRDLLRTKVRQLAWL